MILGLWSCSSQGYLWVTDVASADSSVRAGWQLGAQLFPTSFPLQNYSQKSETPGVTF